MSGVEAGVRARCADQRAGGLDSECRRFPYPPAIDREACSGDPVIEVGQPAKRCRCEKVSGCGEPADDRVWCHSAGVVTQWSDGGGLYKRISGLVFLLQVYIRVDLMNYDW